MQKRGLKLWHRKDLLAPTPSVRQPLFETSEFSRGKRPIVAFGTAHEGRKKAIKEGKRPINANGQFSGTPPLWKTAPLKRPIKRSMIVAIVSQNSFVFFCGIRVICCKIGYHTDMPVKLSAKGGGTFCGCVLAPASRQPLFETSENSLENSPLRKGALRGS